MASTNASVIGLAKQTAKGTPNVTDAEYTYMLFTQGGVAPQNVVIPLDAEVGGGPMIRDMKKVGVTSGGALEFIPRPLSLGHLLMGLLGKDTKTANGTAYTHTFGFNTDKFDVPYYTLRNAPGNLWGEQYQDCRVSALTLDWKAPGFLRANVGFSGGLPSKVATTNWAPATYLDSGPQFLTPVGSIKLPADTAISVLSGSFVGTNGIPLDEQWVVGSYVPEAFDVVSRAFLVNFVVKVSTGDLYSKMMFDKAGGATWAANIFKEGFELKFNSDMEADGVAHTPFSVSILQNGSTGDSSNIVWSAQPIGIRAGRNILMSVTGMFLADATKSIEVALVNAQAAAY